ncbi:IclR family transcriptional regulator [Pigmentiphaga sp.]|jgi:Transcriptional regulator|uniref:IclR family transcriptional regulator n=1 Tax=Pigmentiphaga sp. TaxID=1977564 RepID=UPI0025DE6E50|nr:IclR family transcriptional regulator [Pigmentiphaga sp.]MBX6317333.1 IclR family transcriptional regulator [Pigmentiphaga sp.]
MDAAPDKYVVPGLERGLRVLCEIGRGKGGATAPELARRLGVPRTTVFRLLATLERLGFVQRAENGRDYSLGMAVLRLGFEYLASLELTQLGAPLLERVRDEFNLSCHLVVRDGPDIVYVAKAAANTPLASSVNVGTRLPAHATVLGRVLMADMSLEQLRELYPEGVLPTVNAFTPRTVEQLYALLQRDRERPYLLHEGFFESGISTLAAPVRQEGGAIAAALGVAMPAVPIEASRLERLARAVCESAAELSALLNYRGPVAYGLHEKLNGMVA